MQKELNYSIIPRIEEYYNRNSNVEGKFFNSHIPGEEIGTIQQRKTLICFLPI